MKLLPGAIAVSAVGSVIVPFWYCRDTGDAEAQRAAAKNPTTVKSNIWNA